MDRFPPHAFEGLLAQAAFTPVVENENKLEPFTRVCVQGMGGSQLAGEVIRGLYGALELQVHSSYGLPEYVMAGKEWHVIVSSFSGETAESLDAFYVARERGFTPCVVTSGGKLLEEAKKVGAPYIVLPDVGVAPREALLLSVLAHLQFCGLQDEVAPLQEAVKKLQGDFDAIRGEGDRLADFLLGKQVLLYAPPEMQGLMEVFKINFNETSRVPTSIALFSEVNHGEVEMFDGNKTTEPLSSSFAAILFVTNEDDPRMKERVDILANMLKDRGVPVETKFLKEWSWHTIFRNVMISMRVSATLAERAGLSEKPASLIKEFKDTMRPIDFPEER